MKKLTSKQCTDKTDYVHILEEAAKNVDAAITTFNHVLQDARPAVEQALENYNDALLQVREFCEQVAIDQQNFFDDKSEKWQESDRGQVYQGWINEWSNIVLEDAEVALPDKVEVPDLSDPDILKDLPEKVDTIG